MKLFPSLDMRHFAAAIQILTLSVLLYVILAMPQIAVLHAPPVTRPIGSMVR